MNSQHTYSLARGVLVEELGSELAVLVPGTDELIKLSGAIAERLREIQAATPVSASDHEVAELVNLGVISRTNLPSRRSVIKVGAVGASAGVAALALPVAAAASSTRTVTLGQDYQAFWFYTLRNNGADRYYIFALSGDFADRPNESPSALSVLNTTTGLPNSWTRSSTGSVEWELLHSGTVEFPASIPGSFTWGDTNYSVTFVQAVT